MRADWRVEPWSATCWSVEHWNGVTWETIENFRTPREAHDFMETQLEAK